MSEVEYYQITTTTNAEQQAADLARSAVEARVAACAQLLGPVTSVYWWEARVDTATEWLVVFKTTAERSSALVEHVRDRHPYEIPEIIVTPIVGGNPAYLAWVGAETRQG